MKKLFLILCIIIAFISCIHSDKSKEEKQQAMSATLETNVIRVPYDSAFVEVCDTAHKPIPYDSSYVYLKDSFILQKRKWLPGNKKVFQQIPVTIHVTAYWDSAYLTNCRIDTLKGYKDSIPSTATEFGVKINSQTLDAEVNIMSQLGVKWARDQEVIGSFTGVTGKNFRRYKDSGYKVALNIKEFNVTNADGTKSPKPFPKDTVKFKQQLEQIVVAYKDADIIVIGNEPFNSNKPNGQGYYIGPLTDYENELAAAVGVCHKYGVKVADGGLLQHRLLAVLIYEEKYRNKTADAETFASKYLRNADIIAARNHTGIYLFADSLLQIGVRVKIDYFNIHAYFPNTDSSITPNVTDPSFFEIAAEFLRRRTGKELIANEIGQSNYDPQLVKDMGSSFKKGKYKVAIWWSGLGIDGADAKPLTEGNTTTLGENGKAFRDAIK